MKHGFRDGFSMVLREPLLHFLLLGAAIYILYGLAGPKADESPSLRQGFRAPRALPPSRSSP